MQRFLELSLPQQLLVVGLFIALFGVGAYFLLLSPMRDNISAQERKYKQAMAEYAKLKEFDVPEFKDKMQAERAEALRKKREYEKMLPREEELPDLIASLKADADLAWLTVTRFEPQKNRVEGQGYRGIPFVVEATGRFSNLVQFFRTLSAPGKRLVTPKELAIDVVQSSGEIEKEAADVGPLRILKEREQRRALTSQEQYAKQVLLFEEIAKNTLLKVRFTAYAYVYTGGVQAPAGGAQ
jgi:Tfp pilus assembly protein PilO